MARQPAGRSGGRPSRRHRHHSRRHGRSAAWRYAPAIIALLLIGFGVAMVWLGSEYFLHGRASRAVPLNAPATANVDISRRGALWQRDVLTAFDQAAQQVKAGDTTGAEVEVDQAVAEMEEFRIRTKNPEIDFFRLASSELDRVLKAQPSSNGTDASGARLFEHVTQARIELAQVRSSQEPLPPGSELASDANAGPLGDSPSPANSPSGSGVSGAAASGGAARKFPSGHVQPDGPRDLAANQVMNPASLGGSFLDASLFPDTSEILLPPERRQLSDNVRVENLTIAGASQTLDGIHWRNVTFINTRLRYEDGPLDLQNVRFVHCTFGFPSDERGAALATAIALGQTSITLQ